MTVTTQPLSLQAAAHLPAERHESSSPFGWYALLLGAHPEAGARVTALCGEFGFIVFAPVRRELQKRPAKRLGGPRYETRTVETPLLHRWIAVRLPTPKTPFHLFMTPRAKMAGVLAFAGSANGGPQRFDEKAVDALRARFQAGEFDTTERRRRDAR